MPLGEIATRIIMTQNTKPGSRDHTLNLGIKPLPVKLVIFLLCFLKLHMTKICLKLVRPTLLLCKSVRRNLVLGATLHLRWLKQSHSMLILCYFIIKAIIVSRTNQNDSQ